MPTLEELCKQKEELDKQIKEARKSERKVALKMVKRLCKEFKFTENTLKGCFAPGGNVPPTVEIRSAGIAGKTALATPFRAGTAAKVN